MRMLRSYIAGGGVTAALVMAVLVAFLVVGSSVPYSDWPLLGSGGSSETIKIAGGNGGESNGGSADGGGSSSGGPQGEIVLGGAGGAGGGDGSGADGGAGA